MTAPSGGDEMAELLLAEAFEILRESLPSYLPRCRWFASKASRIASVDVWEDFPMGEGPFPRLLFLNVSLDDGSLERYALPISCVTENAPLQGQKNATICQVRDYFLADGVFDLRGRRGRDHRLPPGRWTSGDSQPIQPGPYSGMIFVDVVPADRNSTRQSISS